MNPHEKLIAQMESVLKALEKTPVQEISTAHPASTIRELATEILKESCAKYPAGGFALPF